MKIEELYTYYLASSGVSIDSRSIGQDEIFFALKGPNFDGHKYIESAFSNGAKYAVIEDESFSDDSKTLLVSNVEEALQHLARYHRCKLDIPVVGITGSNGKTTTKELIFSVLKTQFNAFATKGNLNNHLGVPLSILSIKESHNLAIIEMGANHQKEIKFLSEICMPDIGLITNIGKAHLEGFGDLEGVRKGKTELYQYLQDVDGTILYNEDDNLLVKSLPKNTRNIKYSLKEDIRIISNYPTLVFEYNGITITSSLSGEYNLVNILAALTLGDYFELSSEDLKKGIEAYVPTNNRSQIKKTKNNVLFLDAYNANPSSMVESIRNFSLYPGEKKTLILGHMLELGESSNKEHQILVDLVQSFDWDHVFLVGEEFNSIEVPKTVEVFKTTEALSHALEERQLKNQTILLKGSRGIALEKCIDRL